MGAKEALRKQLIIIICNKVLLSGRLKILCVVKLVKRNPVISLKTTLYNGM